jgi:hypothetical protein
VPAQLSPVLTKSVLLMPVIETAVILRFAVPVLVTVIDRTPLCVPTCCGSNVRPWELSWMAGVGVVAPTPRSGTV